MKKIDIPILQITKEAEERQIKRLREVKASRNAEHVKAALEAIVKATRDGANLMPPLIEAAHRYVTLGEICDVLREEFGIYEETPVF
jgi:methylmalonyl-CoA mutase N-terminal domain/subunit